MSPSCAATLSLWESLYSERRPHDEGQSRIKLRDSIKSSGKNEAEKMVAGGSFKFASFNLKRDSHTWYSSGPKAKKARLPGLDMQTLGSHIGAELFDGILKGIDLFFSVLRGSPNRDVVSINGGCCRNVIPHLDWNNPEHHNEEESKIQHAPLG